MNNWHFQWDHFLKKDKFIDNDRFLFSEWIYPNKIEDFRGKSFLDCGCGMGLHLSFISDVISRGVGVDLNTEDVAKRFLNDPKIKFLSGDIAKVDLKDSFDVVCCIGVLHHTDDPAVSFRNIKRFVKPGGRLIIWVYSREGNFMNRAFLEGFKTLLVRFLPRRIVAALAWTMTALLYAPVYSLYMLPLRFLPFHEYFKNFRALTFTMNYLNVFDKLNAPQTHFIRREEVEEWFDPESFRDIHISPYVGVSWRASGTLK